MSTSLVVLGPTASGKSDVAMAVATDPGLGEWGPFEIVAVRLGLRQRRMVFHAADQLGPHLIGVESRFDLQGQLEVKPAFGQVEKAGPH